jgi:formate hydrogenlyase subunit 3/multisubunit Na+/H+ antiporter MnhD subunit
MIVSTIFSSEHLHVVLNHVPVVGIPFACLLLLYAVVKRDRNTLFMGFSIMILSILLIPVIMYSGEAALQKFAEGSLSAELDEAGQEWMFTHYQRAMQVARILYIFLIFPVSGLVCMWKFPRLQYALGITVLFFGMLCSFLLAWVADSGGKIRHTEFRQEPVPSSILSENDYFRFPQVSSGVF